MAVEFPLNPTNGQTWDGWIYDSSLPGWRNANAAGASPKTGLTPVAPTSVVITTGTGSANQLGTVTFSAAAIVSLNGVFTSAYKNYRVVVNYSGNLAPNVPSLKLRAAGTDNSTNYYYSGASARPTSSVGLWGGNSGSSVDLGRCNSSPSATTIDLFNPYEAKNTPYAFMSSQYDQAGQLAISVQGTHTVATQYDGFSFFCNAAGGLLTGTVTVYGYNN